MENGSPLLWSSTMGVNDLISYEKGVTVSFKHCSESNFIYGELIIKVKQLLTELFKTTSEIQTLIFNNLEKVKFEVTLKEDQGLLLKCKYTVMFLFYLFV